ncbi:hypothetical protein D9619_004457 [Psilocybe cf. subviscida]|uniref:Protein arginine methyltransferase NDUFAF7 n=1 Tax=Psilocybe cf. subviscida TaxID=2480587 RepID=A0A8H5F880_9AGAR|nr:hypothetical protein D9619_004457 [Psilocybe cf. subviscida]
MLAFSRACPPLAIARHGRSHLGTASKRLPHLRLTHSAVRHQTVVEKYLLDHIKALGPLSFATYMQQCLSHPTHGYYTNPENKVFGARGDFITSPEISQVFGELAAVWLLSQHELAGKPSRIRLVELGPGKGTLMADILRVVQHFLPGKDINVHLVETSEAMRETQRESLANSNATLHWHSAIKEIPNSASEYTMLIAHEFFDALPVHIFQKSDTGHWHEILVDASESEAVADDAASESSPPKTSSFRYVLSPQPSTISTILSMSSPRFKDLPAGATIEVSPNSFRIARKVGELLASSQPTPNSGNTSIGGAGLIVDYGGDRHFDNSFRAFKNHKMVDVFHEPGNCDITANVDFAYLKESMTDLVATHGPMSQQSFLEGLGLQLRVEALVRNAASDEQREQIRGAVKRLTDPNGMGGEYQVLGITSRGSSEGIGPSQSQPQSTWPFVAPATQ